MAVLNSWRCYDCKHSFDADNPAEGGSPPCAACGSVEVGWLPVKMTVRHTSTSNKDAIVQDLADAHGLTDLNPHQRYGEAAIRSRPANSRQELQERAMRGEAVSGFVGPGPEGASVANSKIAGKVGAAGAAYDPKARALPTGGVVGGAKLPGVMSMTRVVGRADGQGKIVG